MIQHLFDITFLTAAPFWALMILAPRWHRTRTLVASPLICLPALAIYAILALPRLATFFPALADPNLPGLQDFLGSSAGAAVAWAHFVAFDLFMGRWIYFDSRERGIPPALISVLLVGTIFFAALGVLIYLLIRYSRSPRQAPEPVLAG